MDVRLSGRRDFDVPQARMHAVPAAERFGCLRLFLQRDFEMQTQSESNENGRVIEAEAVVTCVHYGQTRAFYVDARKTHIVSFFRCLSTDSDIPDRV